MRHISPSLTVVSLLAVLAFGASDGVAQWWWWPPDMSVEPPCPTTHDPVTITLWGDWPDSCIPNGSTIWLGTNGAIYFDVFWNYPPDIACLTVITPWERSETIGPLPAGVYCIYATLYHHPWIPPQPELVGTFTVRHARSIGDMNCDGQVNFADINAFVLALGGQAGYEAQYPLCNWLNGDCNGDGTVNFADINLFVTALSSSGPRVAEQSHSGCLGGVRDGRPGCENDDEIVLTIEDHTLHVLHRNATYNCCLDDIVISLTVHGNLLRLDEEALEYPCFCICCYSVEATIVDLGSGTYTVEFCWNDRYESGGVRCDVQQIVVP